MTCEILIPLVSPPCLQPPIVGSLRCYNFGWYASNGGSTCPTPLPNQDPAVRSAYLGGASHRPSPRAVVGEASKALLEVGRLEAGYGAAPVLKGIDLRVNSGELVAVLGANGAGKSTLMRALAGLHRPVRGEIALEGEDLSTLAAHRVVGRGVVLVPEGRQVFPELSVLDNIRLGAYLR